MAGEALRPGDPAPMRQAGAAGPSAAFPVLDALLSGWIEDGFFVPRWLKARLLGWREWLRRHGRPSWPAGLVDAAAPVFLGVFLLGVLLNLVEPFGLGNAT